jgi:hypothetical protein
MASWLLFQPIKVFFLTFYFEITEDWHKCRGNGTSTSISFFQTFYSNVNNLLPFFFHHSSPFSLCMYKHIYTYPHARAPHRHTGMHTKAADMLPLYLWTPAWSSLV